MLPDKITEFIGKTGDTVVFEIERGAIKKFADAVGEDNPLYWDHEYAQNSRYGKTIAPPGFFGWPVTWDSAMPLQQKIREDLLETLTAEGLDRVLDGGIEIDFFQPVYAGDTLAASAKVVSINEKEGKGGRIVFSTVETTYKNQHNAVVAKQRQTLIAR